MIKKIVTFLLLLSLYSCGGVTYVAGLKFKGIVNSKSDRGNPNSTTDTVKLKDGNYISFGRPMGNCGTRVSFFGILLPVIPVKFSINSCQQGLVIDSFGQWSKDNHVILGLSYGDNIIMPDQIENLTKNGYRKRYEFNIKDFKAFKKSKNKAIIVTGNGFTEKLPVKWGIMPYYNWAIP